jgi:hypothetical protein
MYVTTEITGLNSACSASAVYFGTWSADADDGSNPNGFPSMFWRSVYSDAHLTKGWIESTQSMNWSFGGPANAFVVDPHDQLTA